MDDTTAVEGFLALYLRDLERGLVRSAAEYQRLFPRHALAIARELGRLESSGGPPRPEDPEPAAIGPYRILRPLGQGGQAEVFLAEDASRQRTVALKVLRGARADSAGLARFRREAQLATRLAHPGICPVLDTGLAGGIAYIAMPYVAGKTLAHQLAEGRTLPGKDRVLAAVELVERAALALHVAHESGVIHRDVKPANLIVTPEGQPVLLDFGLSRLAEGNGQTLTRSHAALGTPAYMAPEQVLGLHERIDRRADVWALGVVLYECLTLQRPFDAPTREGMYRRIVSGELPDPRRLHRALPRPLTIVLRTALQKRPDHRYQTALDLAEDLRRVRTGQPIRARIPRPWVRAWRWTRREPLRAGLLGTASLVLALGGYLLARVPDLRAATSRAFEERVEDGLEDGFFALAQEQPERAAALFGAALRLAPQSLEAAAGLALANLGAGRAGAALDCLPGARPELGLIRVAALRALGRDAEALAVEQGLPEPQDPIGLFVAAQREIQRSRVRKVEHWRRAAELLELAVMRSLRARPLYHYAWVQAAMRGVGDARAHQIGASIARLWPDSPRSRYWIGYSKRGLDPEGALADLHEALRQQPDLAEAWVQIGIVHGVKGDHATEADAYRRALALRPDHGGWQHNLGIALRAQGALDAALAAFRAAARNGARLEDSLLEIGEILREQGDLAGAADALRQAVRIAPDYATAQSALAVTLRRTGGLAEAMQACREAVRLSPEDGQERLRLCNLLVDAGDLDQAIVAGKRAVELRPQDRDAHAGLAWALLERGSYRAAATSFGAAHELARAAGGERWIQATAAWLADAERLSAFADRLDRSAPSFASAADAIAAARSARADACTLAAAGRWATALTMDPARAISTNGVEAAGAAVLASHGIGADAAALSPAERAAWRMRALGWLEAELSAWRALPAAEPWQLRRTLGRWQLTPDLAPVRDPATLQALPAAERERWERLWRDAAELHRTVKP